MVRDPVCGMDVNEFAAVSSTFRGQLYLFCSPGCKHQFEQQPQLYASRQWQWVNQ